MDVLALATHRLLLPLMTAHDGTAIVEGRRPPHWALDFPTDDDRDIAGLLTSTGIPPGHDAAFGPRLVMERDSGLAVGTAGFHGPPAEGRVEIGYGLVKSRRGRGYATEAVRALTAFALSRPDVTEVVAGVDPGNLASVHVLEKAGFTLHSRSGDEDRYVLAAARPRSAS